MNPYPFFSMINTLMCRNPTKQCRAFFQIKVGKLQNMFENVLLNVRMAICTIRTTMLNFWNTLLILFPHTRSGYFMFMSLAKLWYTCTIKTNKNTRLQTMLARLHKPVNLKLNSVLDILENLTITPVAHFHYLRHWLYIMLHNTSLQRHM